VAPGTASNRLSGPGSRLPGSLRPSDGAACQGIRTGAAVRRCPPLRPVPFAKTTLPSRSFGLCGGNHDRFIAAPGGFVGPMPCPAQSEHRMLRPRPGPKGCGTGRMPVIASVIGVVAKGAGPCTLALAQVRCGFVPWFAVTAAASRQLLQPAWPQNRHSCALRPRRSETAAPEDRRRLSKR